MTLFHRPSAMPLRALALAAALAIAAPAAIAASARFCGQQGAQLDVNGERVLSDLGIEAALDKAASAAVCAQGYFAEKCGDHASANLIFDKCIAAGYPGAMIWKALLLEHGKGVPRDVAQATALLKRAAESGSDGYATIGKLHYASALLEGRGVVRDEFEARVWFGRAAAEGDPDAMEYLRTGHHTGERDSTGQGVGTATEAVEGQRLEREAPADAPSLPGGWLLLALAALIGGGALAQARRARMPAGAEA